MARVCLDHFSHFLITAHVPEQLVDWVTATISSRWMFLLALNVVLLVVGCLMDIFSAIVVVVPLIVPLGVAFGVGFLAIAIVFKMRSFKEVMARGREDRANDKQMRAESDEAAVETG